MKTEPAVQTPQAVGAPPVKKLTPKQLKRERRKRALGRFWKQFRHNKAGMAGLSILVFFAGGAIYSIFADKGGLGPTIATGGPRLAGPLFHYPLCTQNDCISVRALVVEGSRGSLFVGLGASLISVV